MLQRCENSNDAGYKNYGGRGIKVCKRWHTFENFHKDVGDRPEGLTLDRWPDNDGNYKPGNVRWATWKEQANNRRSSINKMVFHTWYITTPQKDALKALSERTGLTMSEILRRSIDHYLSKEKKS